MRGEREGEVAWEGEGEREGDVAWEGEGKEEGPAGMVAGLVQGEVGVGGMEAWPAGSNCLSFQHSAGL